MGPLTPLFETSGDICPRFQSMGGFLACMLPHLCTMDSSDSPLVQHLLLYRDQHGSQAFLIQEPTDMSASSGGGLGIKPMTVHAAYSKHRTVDHSATPGRLVYHQTYGIWIWFKFT